MRNNIVLFIMLMSFLSFQTEYCTADSKIVKKENNASVYGLLDDLQRGEWLNKKYIDKLKSTKSPQISVEGIVEDSFSIKKRQGDYFMMVISSVR